MYLLSVSKFTAKLYCICLSSDLRFTWADAVQICGKFWDTQYQVADPNPLNPKYLNPLGVDCRPILSRSVGSGAAFFKRIDLDQYLVWILFYYYIRISIVLNHNNFINMRDLKGKIISALKELTGYTAFLHSVSNWMANSVSCRISDLPDICITLNCERCHTFSKAAILFMPSIYTIGNEYHFCWWTFV